ncbi:hypothetical protein BV22DRAFT_1019700 [Leucogyrophana mollusca]|uniref:Uncharacterized protein n=1 Tax=Leucogyrophana mollusca TaxID=85980 RepID=A0ACB8B6E7_9AGAM|nr:hypothetical protein BV22DRAFT_1019700 [Leucogyrophana mollusca]
MLPNQTIPDSWAEGSILDGMFLGVFAYGVHTTLFFMCQSVFWSRKRSTQDILLITYISFLFAISSVVNGTIIKFVVMSFVDGRSYPGGPSAYYLQQSTQPVIVTGNVFFLVNGWFQDGLLLYRLWAVWARNLYVVAVPALMFATSLGDLALVVLLCRPGVTIWAGATTELVTPYVSLTVVFNVLITLLIIARLLFMRRHLHVFTSSKPASPYISLSAMLVESAALFSAVGLVYVVGYATSSSIQHLVFPMLGQVQSIAPLLIIFRVAQGKSWSSDPHFHSQPSQKLIAATGGSTLVLSSSSTIPSRVDIVL